MGRYIKIQKYKEEKDLHYYCVTSPDFPDIKMFYILIDAHNKSIAFFKANVNEVPDYIIYLDNIDQKIVLDWVPHFFIHAIIFKAHEAIMTNNFSEFISYQS